MIQTSGHNTLIGGNKEKKQKKNHGDGDMARLWWNKIAKECDAAKPRQ